MFGGEPGGFLGLALSCNFRIALLVWRQERFSHTDNFFALERFADNVIGAARLSFFTQTGMFSFLSGYHDKGKDG